MMPPSMNDQNLIAVDVMICILATLGYFVLFVSMRRDFRMKKAAVSALLMGNSQQGLKKKQPRSLMT
jgi:hypothetical protein